MEITSVDAVRARPSPRLGTATSFWARTVVDRDGKVLGSISDLMLDLELGCVAYAVVARGGFVGVGERLFALPWSALHAVGQQFALDCGGEALETAPAFDWEHYPVSVTPDGWHERMHAHYHSRPYWE